MIATPHGTPFGTFSHPDDPLPPTGTEPPQSQPVGIRPQQPPAGKASCDGMAPHPPEHGLDTYPGDHLAS